jgi:uncharacterized protein (TIGR02145 family)
MKYIVLVLIVFSFFSYEIKSQKVIGKLIDENSTALAEVQLQLYASPNVYNATSDTDGTFSFDIITGVEDNQLPTGYSVSDNFPNPFNPTTRIGITLPSRKNVKVEVFNLLGQTITDVIEQTFDAGTNYIDIELNGVPNGFYISRITIDNKHTVVKKLMLIYGTQHLTTSGVVNTGLNKSDNAYLETILDSLVATNVFIGRKTFTNLPVFVSDSLDLGNLTIERYCPGTPTVLYEGKTYHTVQIGSQCWLKENLNVGIMIQGFAEMTDNDTIEKYCYDNDSLNCETYGGLYKWPEAMKYNTTLEQGICPPGWHLPVLSEFQTLITTVNNNGNALKAIGQGSGSGAGTNISGFSALLAGARWESNLHGRFRFLHFYTYFWGSSRHTMTVYYLNDILLNILVNFEYGQSVRCVKN